MNVAEAGRGVFEICCGIFGLRSMATTMASSTTKRTLNRRFCTFALSWVAAGDTVYRIWNDHRYRVGHTQQFGSSSSPSSRQAILVIFRAASLQST